MSKPASATPARRRSLVPTSLTQPWAIREAEMRLILSIWSRGHLFLDERQVALVARDGEPLENTRSTTVRDGVAIIPVQGSLMRHASLFCDVSGATSYEAIRKDLQVALDDPVVRAILLEFDSPGGEVRGVAELAAVIFKARAKKPIYAYVDGLCASAAYYLGSACDEIIIPETGIAGSIGVLQSILDDSNAMDKAGVKLIEIISSGAPNKRSRPIDDAVIGRQQHLVNRLEQVFVNDVARYRGVPTEKVLADFGQGGVLVGSDAVAAGMVDRIGDEESLIAELLDFAKGAVSVGAF